MRCQTYYTQEVTGAAPKQSVAIRKGNNHVTFFSQPQGRGFSNIATTERIAYEI